MIELVLIVISSDFIQDHFQQKISSSASKVLCISFINLFSTEFIDYYAAGWDIFVVFSPFSHLLPVPCLPQRPDPRILQFTLKTTLTMSGAPFRLRVLALHLHAPAFSSDAEQDVNTQPSSICQQVNGNFQGCIP